jgi:hypothetical protein
MLTTKNRRLASHEIALEAVAVGARGCKVSQGVQLMSRQGGCCPLSRRARDDVLDLQLPAINVAILAAEAGPPEHDGPNVTGSGHAALGAVLRRRLA